MLDGLTGLDCKCNINVTSTEKIRYGSVRNPRSGGLASSLFALGGPTEFIQIFPYVLRNRTAKTLYYASDSFQVT